MLALQAENGYIIVICRCGKAGTKNVVQSGKWRNGAVFVIHPAQSGEYEKVRSFYRSLISAMKDAEYEPGWEIDVYPAPAFLQESIAGGALYVGELDGKTAACMVVNQQCNEGYRKIDWPSHADPKECMVIHALGVHPDFAGHGLAKQMVQKAVSLAKDAGMKAVRLDVLGGNLPAEKLYEGQGFRKVQTIPMYYEDTGWTDYEGYELVL